MTAPNYDTDLQTFAYADAISDTAGGSWDEATGHAGGGAETSDSDYFVYGTSCITQAPAGKTGTQIGLEFERTAAASYGAEDCFFVWSVLLAGNATGTFQQGGMRTYLGNNAGDWYGWKVGGSDFGRNPIGGWQNTAVWPSFTPDYSEGTPTLGGSVDTFASIPNMHASISKGNLHGVDIIRWGRGELIVSGGSLGDGYCNFEDASLSNDDVTNARWGLFQNDGGSFLQKGIFEIGIGHDHTATPTSAAFYDANRNIVIDNCPRTYRDFNKIEIRNTGSFVYWDNIQVAPVSAGGSLSRGILEVVDNPTGKGDGLQGLVFESCVFTDMFEHIYQPNCTLNNTTYRRCGEITQNSASFEGCLITDSPSAVALVANDVESISNCDFVSTGTGHAIELTEDHIQGGEYTITGTTFTGYATVSGGTRNEAIYNNSGNLITLYIDGGDFPSIRNGAGANTEIILATTYTITGVVSGSEVQIVRQDALDDDDTVDGDEDLYHVENTTVDDGSGKGTTKVTYTYNYTEDIPIYAYVHNLGYKWYRLTDTLTNTNKSVPISQEQDRNYSNP